MDAVDVAREYYRTIDEDDYETLTTLLEERFVHERPDRRLEGRDRFVTFMREERPETETEHEIETAYVSSDGDVAMEGTLRRADGSVWFRYVDAFDVEDDRIVHLRTYTDDHPL